MAGRIALWITMAFVAVVAGGCSTTAPARFYTLDSTAAAQGGAEARYAVAVGPVSIPASVDRPQFVVQVAPNRVEVEEFDRWAAPLGDSIARAVAGDLATLLGTSSVAAGPLANFDPTYRVTLDVQRFDSVLGDSVLVDAVWVVRKTAGGPPSSGRSVAHEPAQGPGFEALAAAHSRALATVSADIAAAIQTEARKTR
jgi:hypothetical protein